jgi:hypothetical protein
MCRFGHIATSPDIQSIQGESAVNTAHQEAGLFAGVICQDMVAQ